MHHDNGIWVSTEDLNREESFLQSAEKEFSVENIGRNRRQWAASRRDFLKLMGFRPGCGYLGGFLRNPG
jgi:MoCo/4Fe-4S cofactor protein with predicted Tat translocation signal